MIQDPRAGRSVCPPRFFPGRERPERFQLHGVRRRRQVPGSVRVRVRVRRAPVPSRVVPPTCFSSRPCSTWMRADPVDRHAIAEPSRSCDAPAGSATRSSTSTRTAYPRAIAGTEGEWILVRRVARSRHGANEPLDRAMMMYSSDATRWQELVNGIMRPGLGMDRSRGSVMSSSTGKRAGSMKDAYFIEQSQIVHGREGDQAETGRGRVGDAENYCLSRVDSV